MESLHPLVGVDGQALEARPEPKPGTPEWEMLDRVRKLEAKSGIIGSELLMETLKRGPSGELRLSNSRDKPQVRSGVYEPGYKETKYLSIQQEGLEVLAKMYEFAKSQKKEFIKAHQQYQLNVAKEIIGRQQLYSMVNAERNTVPERVMLQKEWTPAAAEEDLRTAVALYEEGKIHQICQAEKDIAYYWAAHPDLRKRLATTCKDRYDEILRDEARMAEMHKELDRIITATTAVSEIWSFQTMLDEDKVANLLRMVPTDVEQRTVKEKIKEVIVERPITLTDLLKDQRPGDAVLAVARAVPAELRAIPFTQLRQSFRTVPMMTQDSGIPLTTQELQMYVQILRDYAVETNILEPKNRNATAAEFASLNDALEERKREVMRVGEEWQYPSGKSGSQKTQLASRLYEKVVSAHVEVSLQEVLKNGNDLSQTEILQSLKSGVAAEARNQSGNAQFSGKMYELMLRRMHFGAGTRPGGTLTEPSARELQAAKALIIPEPLRSQVLMEFDRYGVGFEEYMKALGQVTDEQRSLKVRLREGTLAVIDSVLDVIDQYLTPRKFEDAAWFVPRTVSQLTRGTLNGEAVVRDVAKYGFDAKWPDATRQENLQRLKERLEEEKKLIIRTVENFNTTPEVEQVTKDVKNLRSLHAIATPLEQKNRDAAYASLSAALNKDPQDPVEIQKRTEEHRLAWDAMGARPEAMALVGGDPILPRGEVDVSVLSKSYITAKERIEVLERTAQANGPQAEKATRELPAAQEELRHVQFSIQGAYEKILFQMNAEHIPALEKKTEQLFMTLLDKFDHHAAEYARYDYLKYVPLSVIFGILTTIGELYYAAGWVPSPIPTLPGARIFRKTVNYVPRKALTGGARIIEKQVAKRFARTSPVPGSAAEVAKVPLKDVPVVPEKPQPLPRSFAEARANTEKALEEGVRMLNEPAVHVSPVTIEEVAVPVPKRQVPAGIGAFEFGAAKAVEETAVTGAGKGVSAGRLINGAGTAAVALDAVAQGANWYQTHQQRRAAEERGEGDTAAILLSKEGSIAVSAPLSVEVGALTLLESASYMAVPAGVIIGLGMFSSDSLYQLALDLNQSQLAKGVLRPSSKLLRETQALGGGWKLRDWFTGAETRRNQRETDLQAYILKHLSIKPTPKDVSEAQSWYTGLSNEAREAQLSAYKKREVAKTGQLPTDEGAENAVIVQHLFDATLRPHITTGLLRATDYIDFATRTRRNPQEKTFDLPDEWRASLLSRSQAVATMYALRSQLMEQNENTVLRYSPRPGTEETLDLSKIPEKLPTQRTVFAEKDMASFDEAVSRFQDFQLWKIWYEKAENVRPSLIQMLAPAIALAEAEVAHISSEHDREATLWDLRGIVLESTERLISLLHDPLVTDLSKIRQEFDSEQTRIAALKWYQISAQSEVTDPSSLRFNALRAALHPPLTGNNYQAPFNGSTGLQWEAKIAAEKKPLMEAKIGGVSLKDCVRVLIDR
ncbi:MAG: hypothetical protein WCG83_04170 [Candidatus Peregrinibacteria bacterium]